MHKCLRAGLPNRPVEAHAAGDEGKSLKIQEDPSKALSANGDDIWTCGAVGHTEYVLFVTQEVVRHGRSLNISACQPRMLLQTYGTPRRPQVDS